jgi:hypothetical protein
VKNKWLHHLKCDFVSDAHVDNIVHIQTTTTQLALKTHINFGCAASLATLDKLVDRFPLPPVAPSTGDTSLTHVMRLAAHSTKRLLRWDNHLL